MNHFDAEAGASPFRKKKHNFIGNSYTLNKLGPHRENCDLKTWTLYKEQLIVVGQVSKIDKTCTGLTLFVQ
jgi:hypothetical protein